MMSGAAKTFLWNFFKSWIHFEGKLKASGMGQWLGPLVLELDHTFSYSGPPEAEP